ncbi:MAG TPA: outer membrane lipoprotein carrier protein LolA [Sedimenticola sp.]|nr:outer membrane lipoprotein carrier protein LolA [Sedimenticola sp.]
MARRSGWTDHCRWLWLWLCWLPVWAADPAARLQLDQPRQFHYEETRHLALLARPWQGSGFLLADPDGTLVKLQLLPERLILVATPDELLYYHPASGERRRLPLPTALPQVQGIVLLQRLLRGDLQAVAADFSLDERETAAGWRLVLTPKHPDSHFRRVTLGEDNGRRYLEIVEADGDRTRMILTPDEQGPHLRVRIARLVQQAWGE